MDEHLLAAVVGGKEAPSFGKKETWVRASIRYPVWESLSSRFCYSNEPWTGVREAAEQLGICVLCPCPICREASSTWVRFSPLQFYFPPRPHVQLPLRAENRFRCYYKTYLEIAERAEWIHSII